MSEVICPRCQVEMAPEEIAGQRMWFCISCFSVWGDWRAVESAQIARNGGSDE